MSYTLSHTPAPLTFTIWLKPDWQVLPGILWSCFIGYEMFSGGWRNLGSDHITYTIVLSTGTFAAVLSLIRRERIEVYPDRMVWRKTYFGISREGSAPLGEVLGADWNEGTEKGEENKGPAYVEFFLTTGSVKACFGFKFDDFDRMREEIRGLYPELVGRWTRSSVRSKNFTLLNLN